MRRLAGRQAIIGDPEHLGEDKVGRGFEDQELGRHGDRYGLVGNPKSLLDCARCSQGARHGNARLDPVLAVALLKR